MKLLEIYLLVAFATEIMITLIALRWRKSHEMQSVTILRLAVITGGVWPLLVFAALQAGGMLVLAKGFGLIRGSHAGQRLPPAHVPETAVDVEAPTLGLTA